MHVVAGVSAPGYNSSPSGERGAEMPDLVIHVGRILRPCARLHRAGAIGNVVADCGVVSSPSSPQPPGWWPDRRKIFARSALRCLLSVSKSRRRPLASHSSRRRRKACSTTVVAQRKSNTCSGGDESGVCAAIDNSEGASAIHSSQETNCTSPPRLRACFRSTAWLRKFCS